MIRSRYAALLFSVFLASALGCGASKQTGAVPSDDGDSSDRIDGRELVTTADNYIQRYEADPSTMVNARLPRQELEIVVSYLRKRYPFESIEHRLEYERGHVDGKHEIVKREDSLDALRSNQENHWQHQRAVSLAMLHSDEVEKFINQDSFGWGRMSGPPNSSMFELPDEQVPLERFTYSPNDFGPPTVLGTVGKQMPTKSDVEVLWKLTYRDFTSPWSLGFVKGLDRVAGFVGHRLERLLAAYKNPFNSESDQWKLKRLELMSCACWKQCSNHC